MNTENKKELTNFMDKKNREAKGEIFIENDDDDNLLKERPKAINQEATSEDVRGAKALATLRNILNMLFVIPLILSIIALFGYLLMNFLPSFLYFAKMFLFSLV